MKFIHTVIIEKIPADTDKNRLADLSHDFTTLYRKPHSVKNYSA
ncbi:hypothetical protein HMPREF9123_1019 [Neisseria bacilliformis ATCC BAA-1200]|uniref:Uncharacterized protein n=1 Tax=Neisseria bacilliformis ATCC BAA-1200 TaxID=888742 RepID=F2BBB4_9NEIS|nr:hypothetical protein HMPREF9123_1019 [Neisseria bacilliformis ATCC BAA-1200]